MTREKREPKVCYRFNNQPQPVPSIVLSGKWLEELGFAIGDKISVTCSEGRMVIENAHLKER